MCVGSTGGATSAHHTSRRPAPAPNSLAWALENKLSPTSAAYPPPPHTHPQAPAPQVPQPTLYVTHTLSSFLRCFATSSLVNSGSRPAPPSSGLSATVHCTCPASPSPPAGPYSCRPTSPAPRLTGSAAQSQRWRAPRAAAEAAAGEAVLPARLASHRRSWIAQREPSHCVAAPAATPRSRPARCRGISPSSKSNWLMRVPSMWKMDRKRNPRRNTGLGHVASPSRAPPGGEISQLRRSLLLPTMSLSGPRQQKLPLHKAPAPAGSLCLQVSKAFSPGKSMGGDGRCAHRPAGW